MDCRRTSICCNTWRCTSFLEPPTRFLARLYSDRSHFSRMSGSAVEECFDFVRMPSMMRLYTMGNLPRGASGETTYTLATKFLLNAFSLSSEHRKVFHDPYAPTSKRTAVQPPATLPS